MRRYGKPFRHFFKRGYRQGIKIKIKAKKMTPLDHYCKHGRGEGRALRLLTAVGGFEGTLDEEAFMLVSASLPRAPASPVPLPLGECCGRFSS